MRIAYFGLFVFVVLTYDAKAKSRIINGAEVPAGTFQEVLSITPPGLPPDGCTATLIGPQTILTNGECAKLQNTVPVKIKGSSYQAKLYKSPFLTSTTNHNMGLGFLDKEVKDVVPATLGKSVKKGDAIKIIGWGCDSYDPDTGSSSGSGTLRMGTNVITDYSNVKFKFMSRKDDGTGAVICYGDFGAPSLILDGNKHYVVGVTYSSNLSQWNDHIRLDASESMQFLDTFINQTGAKICGYKGYDCFSAVDPASCTIEASPQTVFLNKVVQITLKGTGKITQASLENQSVPLPLPYVKNRVATQLGTLHIEGQVSNESGTATCSQDIDVIPETQDKPTCSLTLSSKSIKKGESITVEMTTAGPAKTATLNGQSVPFPYYKTAISPTVSGTVTGFVSGDSGSSQCQESYIVTNDIDPSTPGFTLVPTACGDNVLGNSIQKVCMAVVKQDVFIPELRINDVVLIFYKDGSREAMPVVSRRKVVTVPRKDLLVLYANRTYQKENSSILDLQNAELIKSVQGVVETPVSIVGKSAQGVAFSVPNLFALTSTLD